MAEYTKDDALTFIEAMRLTLAGKVGFKWLVEKLSGLSAFIESLADENEQLKAYLDAKDAEADFASFRAARSADSEPDPTEEHRR